MIVYRRDFYQNQHLRLRIKIATSMELVTRNAVQLQTKTMHQMGFPRKNFKRSSLCYPVNRTTLQTDVDTRKLSVETVVK